MLDCIYYTESETGGYVERLVSADATVKSISVIWRRKSACDIGPVGLCSDVFFFAVHQMIVMKQTNINQECLYTVLSPSAAEFWITYKLMYCFHLKM